MLVILLLLHYYQYHYYVSIFQAVVGILERMGYEKQEPPFDKLNMGDQEIPMTHLTSHLHLNVAILQACFFSGQDIG